MTAQTELTLDSTMLSRGAWLINRVNIDYATQRLEISANWDEEREFQLIFKDFHLQLWQILEDEYDPRQFNADVIGMEIGESGHRKPAVISTDLFEIFVSYGELEIQKDW